MNKKTLTEADIRTKFITPAIVGDNGEKWDVMTQIREEIYFTKGRVIVRGKTVKRGEAKKADYRIVAKVDQLMALVDQLETQLTASCTIAERLMEAVVSELVNGSGRCRHKQVQERAAIQGKKVIAA